MSRQNLFKVGDIVNLKSGGPEMTVEKIFPSSTDISEPVSYRCHWFAGKKLEAGNFAEESLKLFTPEVK